MIRFIKSLIYQYKLSRMSAAELEQELIRLLEECES